MKQKALILLPVDLSLFGYNKDTDYQAKIDEAVAEGNYEAAALYEQQRNDKISGEGLNYEQTNNYSQYLNGGGGSGSGGTWVGGNAGYQGQYNPDKNYDYGTQLKNLMNAGYSDADYLEQLLNERTLKAMDNSPLGQYANDALSSDVRNYISNLRANQYDLDSILAKVQNTIGTAPEYSGGAWDATRDLLARAALDMNYNDWTQSDQYKALADRYGQQGRLSMQDVLGQVASRTGGLASSYAATVANQQYNDYMAQLEEVARQMYAGERSDAIQNAQLAYQYADRDYQQYLDELSQYNNDRSYAYQVLSDALAQSNYNRQWQNTLEQQEYERGQADRNEAKNRVDSFLAAGGTVSGLDSSLVENSGYTAAELAALEQYYAAQNAPKATGGGGGGGGNADGDSTGVVDKMLSYGDDAKAYEYLIGLGYTNPKTEQFWSLYEAARDSGGNNADGGGYAIGDGYTYGELLDLAAAGLTKEQIEKDLSEIRGVDITNPAVQEDIKRALSR